MSGQLISHDVIEAILKAHDIVDTVSAFVRLSKKGKNYSGLCPFHGEKTPSFSVNPETQRFKCFGCGVGGNVISFMMKVSGEEFVATCKRMADEAGIPLQLPDEQATIDPRRLELQTVFEAYELAADLFHHILLHTDQGRPARDYLQGRGFSRELMEQFRIGYAPHLQGRGQDVLTKVLSNKQYPLDLLHKYGLVRFSQQDNDYGDRFYDRVMFPILNEKSKVVAFGGRLLNDRPNQPKYLNSQESELFHKSSLLYGFHLSRPEIKNSQTVVVFEGYVDLIKAWSAGVKNGVATLGTALTAAHVQLLRRYAERIVFCYDADAAGQAAVARSLELIKRYDFHAKVALLPDAKDPDEYIVRYGAAAFRQNVLDTVVSATRFQLLHLRSKYRLQDEGDISRYLREALQLLADVPSHAERELYMKDLAYEFSLPLHTLKQEFQDVIQRRSVGRGGEDFRSLTGNSPRYANDDRKAPEKALLPAYHQAERMLLALMMDDPHMTNLVMQEIGDGFSVDEHAAIAAHLYAYYGANEQASPQAFIFEVEDETLQDIVTSIMMMEDVKLAGNDQAKLDYIRQVKKVPLMMRLNELRERLAVSEKSGDFEGSLQLSAELTMLTKQIKEFV